MTYARYGNSLYPYGTTTRLYGAGVEDSNLHWAIEVDWNGDGVYDGQNEARYTIDLQTQRGRQFYIQIDSSGAASGFGQIQVGTCKVVLDNSNGRYDPYNASSPIYPYVLPGRYIRVRVEYLGVLYPIFAGKIKDIQSKTDSNGEKTVTISCEDGTRLLQSHSSTTAVQVGITESAAISSILTDLSWPSVWGQNIDTSSDILPYWWANGISLTELNKLATANLGIFFVGADGKAVFKGRHNTASAVVTLTSAQLLKDISLPQPWEVVRNVITVVAHPLTAQSSGVLWTMGDKPLVKAGQQLNGGNGVFATYAYNNVPVSAISLITPVATTDFTANTKADGTGTDLTASFTISFTDFGSTGLIKFTNTSGSDGYITFLRVRGQALYGPDSSTVIVNNTASQTTYGKQSFTLDNDWFQDTTFAGNVAAWLNSYMPTPQIFLNVQLESQPLYQFTPDLFDRVNVTISKLSITSKNMNVGYIEHKWLTPNGQAVNTAWYLEPFPDVSGYWIFDKVTGNVTIGVSTVFGL